MVRRERLELSHLAAPEPKSGVSTNFTTPAQRGQPKRLLKVDQVYSSSAWRTPFIN